MVLAEVQEYRLHLSKHNIRCRRVQEVQAHLSDEGSGSGCWGNDNGGRGKQQ